MPSPQKTLKRKRSSSSSSSPFNLNKYIESTKQVDEELGPLSQAHKKPKRLEKKPQTKRYRKIRKSGPLLPHSPEFTNPKTVRRKRYGLDLRKGVVFSSSTLSPQHDPAVNDFVLNLPRTKRRRKPQIDDLNDDSYSPSSSNSPPSHIKPRLEESPLSKKLKLKI